MATISLPMWITLILGALGAGWIDAVIGGGGLILIPLLMATLPGLAPVTVLATNKVAAVSGTASAALTMVRRVRPNPRRLLIYAPLAGICSALGASVAAMVNKDTMRPLIILLLLAVGIFVALKPSFGTTPAAGLKLSATRLGLAILGVGLIGFYDGIFGPGTGMFLIMVLTAALTQDFLTSAAMTKVINTATNIGALSVFIIGGHVWWSLALILAIANIAGAQLGARTVLGGGAKLVRWALLGLVVVMVCYLSYQQWGGLG